jgi:glycosyltransferase involved in cell wall biosynthesis
MSYAKEHVRYSVVVPLYNERESILPLYENLRDTLESLGAPFECLFVDDGSTDESAHLLREIALQDRRVTVVTLPWNSGKSAALGAAFDVALGDYIITMDGDLQHSSSDIPRFIEQLDGGYDIVCGRRLQHTEASWLQRLSNRAANWVIAKLSGVRIHDFGSGFKAYRRELIARLPVYGELQRLIPILALRRGSRICEIPISVAPREHGTSKYALAQKIPFFFDLITVRFLTTYLSRPMHFFGTAGIAAASTGGLIALWLLTETLLRHTNVLEEHGPMMFFATVLILAGMQLFAVGLLAELQVRHYHDRVSGRPPYTVAGARHFAKKNEESIWS